MDDQQNAQEVPKRVYNAAFERDAQVCLTISICALVIYNCRLKLGNINRTVMFTN